MNGLECVFRHIRWIGERCVRAGSGRLAGGGSVAVGVRRARVTGMFRVCHSRANCVLRHIACQKREPSACLARAYEGLYQGMH